MAEKNSAPTTTAVGGTATLNPEAVQVDLKPAPLSRAALSASMSGKEKAAILIVTLGLESAASIFKFLRDEEVEKVVTEIAKVGTVPIDKRDAVIEEAYQRAVALKYVREGGVEYAREILERTLGADKALDFANRIFSGLRQEASPLASVRNFDPQQLIALISHEHPQAIALVILYMEPEQGGMMLSMLSKELQADIAMRIAILQNPPVDVLEQLNDILGRKMFIAGSENTREGGVATLAKLMGFVNRETEKNILEGLAAQDEDLAAEVKSLLFVFEDIARLDDRAIQRVLKEVNTKDLALSLKTANEDLLSTIYRNMSSRSAESLKEEIELLGPVRVSDVGKAQSAVVEVIRALEEAGEIVIDRGKKDDQLV